MSTYEMIMRMALQGPAVEVKNMASGDGVRLRSLLSHPEVQPHIQLRHGSSSQQGVLDKLVNRMLHGYDPHALHAGIYIKGQPELIGSVSLQNWNRHEGKALLGYMLGPSWWGHGYATEALGLLLDYSFRELGLKQIEGRCRGDNLRSARVMLKNGLTLERILPMADGSGDVMKVFTLSYK
ncbi:GNAT family N-acetyltransferase [Paenibacillus tritici]|uniref:GNAT family N-acetyltransferase n=1 Tax=Paenibacillus tritici TaxID=1873425 RepID=A0ABX2DQ46_9BACL|nr:GNAT family N-acetyltransferase [Paenibacillus tritici]NQX45734.1 GNAT family N-acetyltransferase [Paenibacillus tritici]QUL54020.1 GNAT family N-acetyltransferase [Paenibacillus tritici]